jgi:hypothetical protein
MLACFPDCILRCAKIVTASLLLSFRVPTVGMSCAVRRVRSLPTVMLSAAVVCQRCCQRVSLEPSHPHNLAQVKSRTL